MKERKEKTQRTKSERPLLDLITIQRQSAMVTNSSSEVITEHRKVNRSAATTFNLHSQSSVPSLPRRRNAKSL